MSGGGRGTTILDIASRAGVSKSTVSRVLTGAPGVSTDARAAVLACVEELGYTVNPAARSLRTTKSAVVGLHVPAINHDVFGEIAEQLDESLRDQGVSLAITCSGWDPTVDQQALETLVSRGVDALVIATTEDRDLQLAGYLRHIDTPILLLDREFRGLSCDTVFTDHRAGSADALHHLASLGHQRIALLRTPLTGRPGREASIAYRDALVRHGLPADPALEHEIHHTDLAGIRMSVLTALERGATAVVTAGATTIVAEVLGLLRERHLRIPDDVSVVCFDESALAAVMTPSLTAISRPVRQIGRIASRLVTNRLAAPGLAPRVEVVRTSLTVRESTAPAPTGPRNSHA